MAKRKSNGEINDDEGCANGNGHVVQAYTRPTRDPAACKRQIFTPTFGPDRAKKTILSPPPDRKIKNESVLDEKFEGTMPAVEWATIPQRSILKLLQADPTEKDVNVVITKIDRDPAGRDICDVKLPVQTLVGVPCCFLRREDNEQISCQECVLCEHALEIVEARNDKLYLCDNCTGACCGRCLKENDLEIPKDDLRRDGKTGLCLPGSPVLCKIRKKLNNFVPMEVMTSWRFCQAPKNVKEKLLERYPDTNFLAEDEVMEVRARDAKVTSKTGSIPTYIMSTQLGEIKPDWDSWDCPQCVDEARELEEKELAGKQRLKEEEEGYLASEGILARGPYFSEDMKKGKGLYSESKSRLEKKFTFFNNKIISMAVMAKLSHDFRSKTKRKDARENGTPPWVVIEAFAGSGGGKEAATRAGLNVQAVLVIEQDDDCNKVLEERYLAEKVHFEMINDMLDFELDFYPTINRFIENANKHFAGLSMKKVDPVTKQMVPYTVDSSRVLFISGSPCQNFAMVNANAAGIYSMGGRLWSSASIVKAQLKEIFPHMVSIFENVAHMIEFTRSHLISQAAMPCYFLDGADFGIARRSRMYLTNVQLHDLEPYQWTAFHPEDFVQRSSPGATCAYYKANTVMATCPNGKGVNKGFIIDVTDADDTNDAPGYLNLGVNNITRMLNIKELAAANSMPRDFLEIKCNEDIVDATPISEKSQGKIFGNSFNVALTAHLLQDVTLSEGIPWGGFLTQGWSEKSGKEWYVSHGVTRDMLTKRRRNALELAKMNVEDSEEVVVITD